MTDKLESNFFQDPELLVDPFAYYEAVRGQCPVWREPHHDVVLITGYEEALQVYNDTETFSSCTAVTGPFPGFPVPLEGDDVSDLIEKHRDELPFFDQLPALDPPKHTDHRALLMRLITPKRLKENEDAMAHLCDRVIEPFLAGGRGDYISGFAGPFTLLIIAELLGVPEEDQAELADELQHRPQQQGGLGSLKGESMSHSPLEHLYRRFSRYVEERRSQPRADVLTGLATATFPDGSMPTVDDVVRVATNVFSAGQETTVRLLSAAALLLAEDPALQGLLRNEPDRIPNFIEETLRMESPVKGDFRLSRVPTTVGGVDLPAGTTVMVLNAAANRDPRHFEVPTTFDVDRANARTQIAFGRGIHTCPGSPLARAEGRVAIEQLLARTTNIRVSEVKHGPAGARTFHYVPTFILRGLTQLHLEFDLKADS